MKLSAVHAQAEWMYVCVTVCAQVFVYANCLLRDLIVAKIGEIVGLFLLTSEMLVAFTRA